MKAIISKDTFQKMTWLTYGNTLHTYLGSDLPKEYGGTGASLSERALTPKYDNASRESKIDGTATTNSQISGQPKSMASGNADQNTGVAEKQSLAHERLGVFA